MEDTALVKAAHSIGLTLPPLFRFVVAIFFVFNPHSFVHLLYNCKIHCLNLPRLLWSQKQSAPLDFFPLQTLDGIDHVARAESADTAHVPNLYLRAAGKETSTILSGHPCADKQVFLPSGKQCSHTCCLDWLQITLWKKLTLVPEVSPP